MSAGKRTNMRTWIARQLDALAHSDSTRFVRDVFAEPSIGPVTAWLISALVTLVAWLTQHYAPGAIERAADGVQGQDGGIISISMGYWTLGAVGAVALIAAMQPIIAKQMRALLARPLARWLDRLNIVLRAPLELASLLLRAIYHVPAWVFSAADYLLARPVALLAGAGLRPWWLRYGAFLVWMVASLSLAWLSPAPYGLYAFGFGALLVIGVIRRWNWVEADREAFFVARKHDPNSERIGFAEDLRDEALIALLFLFLFIPLGLRQVDLAWPDTFSINGASDTNASVLGWLGFFGAEMAKSVPFVDWSEVFHVANGSPIEPDTAMGAQIVFAMRATLDLIMIAAVVQAIQLGSRLLEQAKAFAEWKVDILEPFTERARLRELGWELMRAGDYAVLRHSALRDFPPYSQARLTQIIDPLDESPPVQAKSDSLARRAALALMAWQRPSQEVLGMLGRLVALDDDQEMSFFSDRLRLEIERPHDTLTRGYKIALEANMRRGGNAQTLLAEFEEFEHSLARRAIRSALGQLDVLVPIPAGSFMMGAPEGEQFSGGGRHDGDAVQTQMSYALYPTWVESSEEPQHLVRVAAFEIGKHPVTFDEFDAFCEATNYFRRETGLDRPNDEGWGRGTRPVINVNWYDAKAYIEWLNSWSQGRYRLPSEAEWEYACRAGRQARYSFGDDEAQLGDYAWFKENSADRTQLVGEKQPNAFGLYDMHGNVSEWVEDPWHDDYHSAPDDGSVWSSGDTSFRVLRGGSWGHAARHLRSAYRFGVDPTDRSYGSGFRIARTV